MKILARMEKSIGCWFLILATFIFFLLRLPSLIEPYWYGDEGIYQVIGNALLNGKLLYKEIWDNKPPLLYIIYALLGSDQFLVRFASLFFGILSIIAFHNLSKKIFADSKIIYITTALYSFLFGIPLLEGNIANSENFMHLPIILAGTLLIEIVDKRHVSHFLKTSAFKLFLGGFLLSLAFLFKVVAVFDFAAFFTYLLFMHHPNIKGKHLVKRIKEYTFFATSYFYPLIGGFCVPIFLTTFIFIIKGGFEDFLSASFVQNVGYVGYGNTLFIQQGLLILKLLILGLFIGFLFRKKEDIPYSALFIYLWFSFSLFNAFFSGRPYIHYLLVLLPSFSLLVGMVIANPMKSLLFNTEKETHKQMKHGFLLQKKIGIVLVISILLIWKQFWFYTKIVPYYVNFFEFISNKKSVSEYQGFFDKKTPRDYEIAQIVKGKIRKNDQVFIWGNNAQVYALLHILPIGKFTVAYHMLSSNNTINQTRQEVINVKPRFIIVMPDVPPLPFGLLGYTQKIVIHQAVIYERDYQ